MDDDVEVAVQNGLFENHGCRFAGLISLRPIDSEVEPRCRVLSIDSFEQLREAQRHFLTFCAGEETSLAGELLSNQHR